MFADACTYTLKDNIHNSEGVFQPSASLFDCTGRLKLDYLLLVFHSIMQYLVHVYYAEHKKQDNHASAVKIKQGLIKLEM